MAERRYTSLRGAEGMTQHRVKTTCTGADKDTENPVARKGRAAMHVTERAHVLLESAYLYNS